MDQSSGRVTAVAELPARPYGIALSPGAVWVSLRDGTVARLDSSTGRLVTTPGRKRVKAMLPLLLVTAAAIALLIVVLRWKAFNPIAGAVGLSAVVLAIGAEIFQKEGDRW